MGKIRDLKYKIKYSLQRAQKGYSVEDLFSIDCWFMNLFPKMLNEFFECTCGIPCNTELKSEIKKMPKMWLEQQRPKINKTLKKYDTEYNLEDEMCCWLLIILRMKYCFERCDEWHEEFEKYWEDKEYEELNKMVEKHKKEAFYLLEKYFFHLWW